jgi:hypothetical protein
LGRYTAVILLVLSFSISTATPGATKGKPSLAPRFDPAYISALAAANRFLQAWQNQDHETGLLMLTDGAKQHSSEDYLEGFFSSGFDTAYEIARGKKLEAGRYAFPITLFGSHSNASRQHRQKTEIVVVRAGKDEWAIDKLP